MKTHTINEVEWTEDQMRVAIAKACGAEWTSNGWGCRYLKMPGESGGYGPDDSSPICDDAISSVPDYLNDLNAMHEVEKEIHPAAIETYVENIGRLVRQDWAERGKNVREFSQHAVIFCHLHATALQRAIAFIQALELKPE